MAYRSMFCYAWDLADEGLDHVTETLKARHINTLTVAGAYHAGKFLRPHGNQGKIYFPEDGTVYFKFHPERYGRLKPETNSILTDHDPFAACCALPDFHVNAWLVLMHNSRLGAAHPDIAVTNAFGDAYIYNLCPAAPAARDYAVALCQDVTDSYPVIGVTLETPGFLPFVHGYHHEFALVRQNSWLNNLLGLCFCRYCMSGATEAGINMPELRQRIAGTITRYLSEDVDYDDTMAEAFWQADIVTDPDLPGLLAWRCRVVESLIADIRAAVRADAEVSVIPSVARPTAGAWYEGSHLPGIADVADKLEVCFYEPSVARINSDLHDVIRRVGSTHKLRAILRPGHPDLTSAAAVSDAVALLAAAGIEDIGFYNYGHLRQSGLDWMGAALAGLDSGT